MFGSYESFPSLHSVCNNVACSPNCQPLGEDVSSQESMKPHWLRLNKADLIIFFCGQWHCKCVSTCMSEQKKRAGEEDVERLLSACDSLATFHRFDSYRRLLWQHAILIRKRVQLKMAVEEPMALPMRLRNQLQSVYELDPLRNEVSLSFQSAEPKRVCYRKSS